MLNKYSRAKKAFMVLSALLLILALTSAFMLGTIFALTGDVSLGGATNTFDGNVVINGNMYASNIKSGSIVGCSNGTWIAHSLPGDPALTGSITLALRGPTQYNATIILCVPTVLSSNATHFQIEFLAWETVTWTLVPVSAVMNQTVWWDAKYSP